jgi:hypothetical protein
MVSKKGLPLCDCVEWSTSRGRSFLTAVVDSNSSTAVFKLKPCQGPTIDQNFQIAVKASVPGTGLKWSLLR